MAISKISCVLAIVFTMSSFGLEQKRTKVVVIGAGLAGLTTAYRLHQEGIDVAVYEARGRVGGRVFTVYVDGRSTELGGQNIADGGEAHHLRRLIKELDLTIEESRISLNSSYFTGENLISVHELLHAKQFDREKLEKTLATLASTANSMQEVLRGVLAEEDPLYKTMAVWLAGYEGAPCEKLSPLYTKTLYHMLSGGICVAHQGSGEEEKYVDLLSVRGGNALLPESIAKVLASRVHLEKVLTRVTKNQDRSYTLAFNDGQNIEADILVLAIPCSLYDTIIFENDSIPLERLESIKKVRYGTNAKIVVPFSYAPLRTAFVNDRMGTFFDPLSRTLTLYYSGPASIFSKDTILDTYNGDSSMLALGFEGIYPSSVSPVYAEDRAFASYKGAVGYSWPLDPYVKGSYSYISPGQESLLMLMQEEEGERVKALFAPFANLYFAGEHTSILTDVPGTMEAACESGERTARMIVKHAFKAQR